MKNFSTHILKLCIELTSETYLCSFQLCYQTRAKWLLLSIHSSTDDSMQDCKREKALGYLRWRYHLACGKPAVYFCLKTQVQKNAKKGESSNISLHLGCFNTMAGKAQVRMKSAESGVSRMMELGSLVPTQRWTINCLDCALLFEYRLQSWTVSWTLPLVLCHRLDSSPLFSCKKCAWLSFWYLHTGPSKQSPQSLPQTQQGL